MKNGREKYMLRIGLHAQRQSANTSLVSVLLSIALLCLSCIEPRPRPGPQFDGSARWAFGIAQPLIANFEADAQLYVIAGTRIGTDGRLPANVGAWSFIAWSVSRQQTFQVTINYAGNTDTETEDRNEPPGRGQPMPADWKNSTIIFEAARPHVEDAPDEVTLLMVNWTDYDDAPGQAVWALSYSSPGGNHRVRWDGVYLSAP